MTACLAGRRIGGCDTRRQDVSDPRDGAGNTVAFQRRGRSRPVCGTHVAIAGGTNRRPATRCDAALPHVSASTRHGNVVRRQGDGTVPLAFDRRSITGQRGNRLPQGLFPCLFRHSAAVCTSTIGPTRTPLDRDDGGEHRVATIDPTRVQGAKPYPCCVQSERVA